jgi:hypothetical protein
MKQKPLDIWNTVRTRTGRLVAQIGAVCFILFYVFVPLRAWAVGLADGGMLEGVVEQCTCSGGQTIRVLSYVDDSMHVYMYEYGATILDMNYALQSTGNYFKTTLEPFSTCLIYQGEDCSSSDESPEGLFMEVGTSFEHDRNATLSLLGQLPVTAVIKNAFSGITFLNAPPAR